MLAFLPLLPLIILVLVLVFWQYSNIKSILLGAPAITSPSHRLLEQVARSPQTWLDLGCGNGSVCLRLAPLVKQVYGIEYSPFYYAVARWRTRRLANVTIIYGNIMTDDWPRADVIHCYLLPTLLKRLTTRLKQAGATVVCLAFPIPGWQPSRQLTGDSQQLYVYEP